MRKAIKNICNKGQRDKLVVAIHTYARTGLLTEAFFRRTLRDMGLDQADVMILGWHNRRPSSKLVERALALKEKGLFRFLGMSGHNRPLFPKLAGSGNFDLFHIRYNAAHRGAETEVFPSLSGEDQSGIVTYTATRWGHLLSPKKMPPGEPVAKPTDCYRFVMSNPAVDVCLCGPKNLDQMQAAFPALDLGPLSPEDMDRMTRIGDHIHSTYRGLFG
ncbi:MAG: hypothetical protein GY864_00425 [Desulfobacterales bacterium]|nr:hypothetical protein [Desulfobacterales bacterium]